MYIPKDYWMICDRCGSTFRKSEMAEEWTGLWVCTQYCWTERHPQDFVTSIPDDPSVPVSRPDVVQSVGESKLLLALDAWGTSLFIVALKGLAEGDPVGIVMDNDIVHWTFIDDDLVVLSSSPLQDSTGALVYDADSSLVYTADGDSGYTFTIHTPVWYAAAFENVVYLPSLNNESWT